VRERVNSEHSVTASAAAPNSMDEAIIILYSTILDSVSVLSVSVHATLTQTESQTNSKQKLGHSYVAFAFFAEPSIASLNGPGNENDQMTCTVLDKDCFSLFYCITVGASRRRWENEE
jgi:hypothetical protein